MKRCGSASPRAAAAPAAEKSDLADRPLQAVKTASHVIHECHKVIMGPQGHEVEPRIVLLKIVNTPPRTHIPVGLGGPCRTRACTVQALRSGRASRKKA